MPKGRNVNTQTAAKPAKEAKAKKAKVERMTHGTGTSYAGPSNGVNSNRSRSVVDHSKFGTDPEYSMTPRTQERLAPMKKKYAAKPWARGDLDVGILKFGLKKGHIEPVTGDGTSEADTYRFTKAGLSQVA